MAIQVKKGIAHSLTQSDFIGTVSVDPVTRTVTPSIVAGMLVRKNADGTIAAGVSATPANDQLGFAVNASLEGDVIESGKIGAYALDGNSVIGTNQVYGVAVDPAVFLPGLKVAADVAHPGMVALAAGANTTVVGSVDSTGVIFEGQTPITMVYIKLA